ncbi:MAG: menaquinone biosynthesis decarboxylase [Bacteroides sp.]|nr:MAG: menaquinone biosynthesis decarboxylase [Bacteroides sp.]
MPFNSLNDFVKTLINNNELINIKEYINTNLEVTEIVDRISKNQGPALLFQTNGTKFPLLINSLGSYKRICLALNINNIKDIEAKINKLFQGIDIGQKNVSILEKIKLLPKLIAISHLMPKNINKRGICQENILLSNEIDVNIFPILKCWPQDGGKFITLPMVHTYHPVDDMINIGMYRIQVFSKNIVSIHWHKHKVSNEHFQYYKENNIKMPIAITLGGDPVYTYCATAPLPKNINEYVLAGILRNKGVEMVKCITQPIRVPKDVDIVIEGYIDPKESFLLEGPFGDHTGYYSLEDYYPKMHITCITYRNKAIYPATIVGIPPHEDLYIGKVTERIFILPLKIGVMPEIIDMRFPIEGVFHNLVIIKINKSYPGQGFKVMNAVWGSGQMMLTKIIIVIDEKIDIYNDLDIARRIFNNINNLENILFSIGPLDVLDHASQAHMFGGKMGIDLTSQYYKSNINNHQFCRLVKPLFNNINVNFIKKLFVEIKDINTELLKFNIPVIFISINKIYYKHIDLINKKLFKLKSFKDIKSIIYLDILFKKDNISTLLWRCLNNIDVKRDSYIIDYKNEKKISFDCTNKNYLLDKFDRKWPEIITSDTETIKKIDKIWNKLNLGKFIESPSKIYKDI